MGQLVSPLQLITLCCEGGEVFLPGSAHNSSVSGVLQAYAKASHWSVELWFLFHFQSSNFPFSRF